MTTTCNHCAHRCKLEPDTSGICGVRRNEHGTIVTLVRDRLVSLSADPVEKKPLYHFLPGTRTLSVALPGCNFRCDFCQNHTISQAKTSMWNQLPRFTPSDLSANFLKSGLPSVSFTYTEPTVWLDWTMESALLVKEHGGLVCMVSNGYYSPETIEALAPIVDAWNIDLKGDDAFYRTHCGARQAPVLDAIQTIAALSRRPSDNADGPLPPGQPRARQLPQMREATSLPPGMYPPVHEDGRCPSDNADGADPALEVTTMVIEGIHNPKTIETLGRFLSDAGVQVWHLSRFFPAYRMMDRSPTSDAFLADMLACARDSGVPFVYGGNSPLAQNTHCPGCGAVVVERTGMGAVSASFDGVCPGCGLVVYGRWI